MTKALLKKVDCLRLHVPDLDEGLIFYRDALGLDLVWRTAEAVGLSMPDTDTEIVLQSERQGIEVDFLVDSADEAARTIEQAGGRVLASPFDIRIGRCVVVQDPWGNECVLLDMSKGGLRTDAAGNVLDSH
jgi:predicted enzyme related to lactoylglutathione lyase